MGTEISQSSLVPAKLARLIIADDHRMVVEAFARHLSSDFEVVGAVCEGAALAVMS